MFLIFLTFQALRSYKLWSYKKRVQGFLNNTLIQCKNKNIRVLISIKINTYSPRRAGACIILIYNTSKMIHYASYNYIERGFRKWLLSKIAVLRVYMYFDYIGTSKTIYKSIWNNALTANKSRGKIFKLRN